MELSQEFYRFQAASGAILNWWPTTGTINFQGHDAEQLEARILKHALAEAAHSERGLLGEECAWEAVPSPTPTVDESREVPSFAGTESRPDVASHRVPRLTSRPVKLLAAPDCG
jgi:hypothetical protein